VLTERGRVVFMDRFACRLRLAGAAAALMAVLL